MKIEVSEGDNFWLILLIATDGNRLLDRAFDEGSLSFEFIQFTVSVSHVWFKLSVCLQVFWSSWLSPWHRCWRPIFFWSDWKGGSMEACLTCSRLLVPQGSEKGKMKKPWIISTTWMLTYVGPQLFIYFTAQKLESVGKDCTVFVPMQWNTRRPDVNMLETSVTQPPRPRDRRKLSAGSWHTEPSDGKSQVGVLYFI